MNTRSLSRLTDQELTRRLGELNAEQQRATAELLADIAEVDARRLYLPAYPTMEEFCVHKMGMDEEEVVQRIEAARVARQFPDVFPAIAEGRLHVEAVILLAPHLTPETVDELLAAATHKTESEIALFLARRFSRSGGAGSAAGFSRPPSLTPSEE
jgi:hypothetical protein